MTGFDYEVCHYFVKDTDRFGERGGDVAEGVEELFYCWGFHGALGSWRERGGKAGGGGGGAAMGGGIGTFGFEI